MSTSKAVLVSALLALVEARFGQEQIPVAAVSDLGAAGFGAPGVAATIAGSIPGALLAAASPCDKLSIADQIIAELGDDEQVIAAAIGLVAAETNFNPFAVDVPFVCADPALPATEVLRGIVPLVDPAVAGSDVENANSAASVATPFDATGLSQAEVMIAQGFSSFTAVSADGSNVVLDGQDGAGAGADAGAGDDAGADAGDDAAGDDAGADAGDDAAGDDAGADAGDDAAIPIECPDVAPPADNGNDAGADAGADTGDDTGAEQGEDAGNDQAGNNDALDFGLCVPTMARVGGLNGRPATEFTFIPQDPLTAEGQQEALNPNIITNRICDQLTNVCEANDAAVAACEDAQAQIEALGTRDQSTADTWNAILGFPDADSTVATL
ncbi:hypothetical protein S7711_01141 [Stachybotrys chartarum IBT 7711]|uniref:Circumsporozoite protein n=1 Tax=Stachybotrys chartarum (strain CBS 109288 / IBT 7711) TaxID=1280523 RepID=A0A084AST4_STACB|nr:hypothetical protein S7711_01141 [Stachybotrys chartarum IBT 7711]KFA48977.1 hypothetical protein S40293_02548 [Stachybotrys chartarum IBT 40293]